MTKAGRLVQVKVVLTSMPIYQMNALEFPPWTVRAVDKLRRGLLWKGRKAVNGGHCPVAWPSVCLPRDLGGLGIHNLTTLGWALRMRWLWLCKTQPDKPWAMFPVAVHGNVLALFDISITSVVGSGANTLFWHDRWIHGQRLSDFAPTLFTAVPRRIEQVNCPGGTQQ
ncbi:hypothetical protein BS78_03G135900 [Paspalum vaginatum]|nr:hypothetical protein BS78_03G135900 [Paspalum vaginatum]